MKNKDLIKKMREAWEEHILEEARKLMEKYEVKE